MCGADTAAAATIPGSLAHFVHTFPFEQSSTRGWSLDAVEEVILFIKLREEIQQKECDSD